MIPLKFHDEVIQFPIKSQNRVVEKKEFASCKILGEGSPKLDAKIFRPYEDTLCRKVWCNSPNKPDDVSLTLPYLTCGVDAYKADTQR